MCVAAAARSRLETSKILVSIRGQNPSVKRADHLKSIQPGSFIAIVSALLYALSVQGIDYRSARVIGAAIVQCGTNIVETDPAPAHSLASVLSQSESRSVVCIIVPLISPTPAVL